jgi:hypothetical protein
LHPILKHEGFQKSARTYRRNLDGCIQIINIQGSSWNSGDQGRFTINLAVYYPEAARIDGFSRLTDRPVESDCLVRQRIGLLMPDRNDFWWAFDADSDLDKIAREVSSAWTTYGKPWLAECSTPDGAFRFILSLKNPYWASIFSLMQGNRETAKNYLAEAVIQARNPHLYSRLQDWGRLNGLVELL